MMTGSTMDVAPGRVSIPPICPNFPLCYYIKGAKAHPMRSGHFCRILYVAIEVGLYHHPFLTGQGV
jgi:hypothetical protein